MPVEWPSVQRTRLENGIRILTEQMPGVQSVTLGIWVENGSRYETVDQAGISHYLEHIFFKGTDRRTAAQIAEEFDSVGGLFNAFTGKESTCYYAKVLGEHLPLACDILGDIFLCSRFDEEEIDRERTVILQEISQSEDTPDDHVHDLFNLQYWQGHPLSFPVCGRVETVRSFKRAEFLDFIDQHYRPNRVLITAAGNVEHATMVDWATKAFGHLSGVTVPTTPPPPVPRAGLNYVRKPLEQTHICLGIPGIYHASPERYAGYLLNSVLGGGMSSRLFQEVREKRGRAYAVYSFMSSYLDAGYLGVYVGTSAEWVEEVIGIVLNELRRLADSGLTTAELTRAKNQLKGNILLGLEGTDSRMNRLARNEIYFGRDLPPSEVSANIDATTNDQIIALARQMVEADTVGITLLGDLDGHPLPDHLLSLR